MSRRHITRVCPTVNTITIQGTDAHVEIILDEIVTINDDINRLYPFKYTTRIFDQNTLEIFVYLACNYRL